MPKLTVSHFSAHDEEDNSYNMAVGVFGRRSEDCCCCSLRAECSSARWYTMAIDRHALLISRLSSISFDNANITCPGHCTSIPAPRYHAVHQRQHQQVRRAGHTHGDRALRLSLSAYVRNWCVMILLLSRCSSSWKAMIIIDAF